MRVQLHTVGKSVPLPLGSVTLLHGVDLVLKSGELCLLTGPTGSGKTTLLTIIGGLARPTTGRVTLEGREPRAGVPAGVSYASQEPLFLPELTVLENLLAASCRGRQGGATTQGERLLEQFGLADCFDLSPELLSGGERRRLGLARALLGTPRLLLLDEPLAFLDDPWRERVMALILETCRECGATLVMATSGTVPGTDCFRQIRLLKGKVIADGVNTH